MFGIWVAVDASKYPDWAFQRAGTQKWLFQILTPIAGLLCGIVTIVLGIVWFASKKAQVEQASQSGPSDGPYGAAGPYGTSQPPASTWGPPPASGGWTPSASACAGSRDSATAGAAGTRRSNRESIVSTEIHDFRVAVAPVVLDDLRDRLARTRWPDQIPGSGWGYGTDGAYLQDLCDTWRTTFDWSAQEERFNRWPHFITEIDGQ